jgi:uncharacterized protein YndB with AHSA1/START domain
MSTNPSTHQTVKQDLVVTRIIDAPVELVWKAWTEPERIKRWWGPQYWTSPSCQVDFREGGRFIFSMLAPQEQGGMEQFTSGVYTKIVPHERIEYVQYLSDQAGNKVDPALIGMPPDFPAEIRSTVTFRRIRPDMTELTVIEYDWPVSQMYVYSLAGLHQTIDKLIQSLA